MAHAFDTVIPRRPSDSVKWNQYDADVLPLWVADMDFASPPAVIEALHARAAHGVFGYGARAADLAGCIAGRMQGLYGWKVAANQVVLLPGVTPGLSLASVAYAEPGQGVVIQSPVYPPIYRMADVTGRLRTEVALVRRADGTTEVDLDALEQAFKAGPRLYVLCNPQNPTGRVFTRAELERVAALCLKYDVTICGDEIHGELVFPPHRHVPIASLSEEVAQRTVTLIAPSKTFNVPGLSCAFAIIPNHDARRRFLAAGMGLVPHVGSFGVEGALAAYERGQPWLDEVLAYLTANRTFVDQFVREHLPGVSSVAPEGTYLTWLDCRRSAASADPYRFFLDRARVALSEGPMFGPPGAGFVRLNFACPRATLKEALDRMRRALTAAQAQ
jgi:cystathionine beta-lyase